MQASDVRSKPVAPSPRGSALSWSLEPTGVSLVTLPFFYSNKKRQFPVTDGRSSVSFYCSV